jgi:hypothetical protein
MKIYLAGCGIIPKKNITTYFELFNNRLLSYWEIQPGRFGASQWKYIKDKNETVFSRNRPRNRGNKE